ncbi:hypothetical protein WH47_04076 [Habropoda laboriosa]|uniref:Uncharacterized protein n=1 Tax=Habropoda laboriosa TaxID=597456 RepID=A0A0L7QUK4_9HYME|nr:hypothetical protein WH47_04076 [Habropoda laboriosa]
MKIHTTTQIDRNYSKIIKESIREKRNRIRQQKGIKLSFRARSSRSGLCLCMSFYYPYILMCIYV